MSIHPLKKIDARELELTIVYDNVQGQDDLASDWGFSCLIRGLDRTVLFDTGRDSALLSANMRKLGIDAAG